MHELYKRYRPKTFKTVLGQPEAVRVLTDMVKHKRVPHALMLTGPSGTGKTTIARILKNELGCSKEDFVEVNCADFRGVEIAREIRQRMSLAPFNGSCRIWLADEFQQATKDCMSAFLKMLEDTPPHVYFILATTDPAKILKTIHTRCTEIKLSHLSPKLIEELIIKVASKEKLELADEVLARLVDVAEGSARKALVLLDQVSGLSDEEEQLNTIANSDSRRQGIEIARALLNPRTTWQEMAKILKGVEEEPESLRHLILGYATNVLLGGGKMVERALKMIDFFRDHFYESKRAGLVYSCYRVLER